MLRIAFVGNYDPEAPRLAALLGGLSRLNVAVTEMRSRGGLFGYSALFATLKQKTGEYDVVVVPDRSLGMLVTAAVASSVPVVWLTNGSKYDLVVNDSIVSARSLRSFFLWLYEWLLVVFADLIVVPSESAANFFAHTYGSPSQKFGWAFVGADDRRFVLENTPPENGAIFEVVYYGDFLVTDGIDTIIRAAKLLEDDPTFRLTLVGDGGRGMHAGGLIAETGATNVTHLPFVHTSEIPRRIAAASAVIGILGKTPYADRYLPERIFAAAAMKRPLLSVSSRALGEAFDPAEHVIILPPGDHEALAAKLRELRSNKDTLTTLLDGAYQRYAAVGTPEAVARRFVEALEGMS